MRIGQTSLVFFVSKVVGSIVGFVATIYFARYLGASVLGRYSLVLAVVAWVGILGTGGITGAVGKRLSEGEQRAEYFTAGLLSIAGTFLVVATLVYAFGGQLNAYLGEPLVHFVVLLLLVRLLDSLVKNTLQGFDLVHVMGMLIPVRMLIRSLSQVGLVFLTFGLVGLLIGNAVGFLSVSVIGLWYVAPSIARPSKHHFESLFSYAKFSWLGGVENRVFGWADIAVLGLFVSPDLIGVYSVCWTISTFFLSFSDAVSNAIFPQISNLSATEGDQAAAPIFTDALRYAGLILLPGMVGGLLLSRRILRIYGQEFQVGGTVLVTLLLAVLLRSYYRQMITAFNGLDRVDVTFRINAVFITSNVVLNVGLVYWFGWLGAAAATALSTGFAMILAYYYLTRLISFDVPYVDISKQLLAATIMGGYVFGLLQLERTYALLQHNFALVLLLVASGAGLYFVSLFGLSPSFRTTVSDNLPKFV